MNIDILGSWWGRIQFFFGQKKGWMDRCSLSVVVGNWIGGRNWRSRGWQEFPFCGSGWLFHDFLFMAVVLSSFSMSLVLCCNISNIRGKNSQNLQAKQQLHILWEGTDKSLCTDEYILFPLIRRRTYLKTENKAPTLMSSNWKRKKKYYEWYA